MPTLNLRRTLVFLVVAIAVAGSAHLLHSYQMRRNSSSFKTQAEAAWNDNPQRRSDALTLMKAYLFLEPHDLEAQEELGAWSLECGQFGIAARTMEELVRALEKQTLPDVPATQRVRRKLIGAYQAVGRWPDAVYHLRVLRKELPEDVDIMNLLGKFLVKTGQEDEGIKIFTAAIAMKKDRVDIYYNKAMALRFSPVPKLAEAEKCMAEMIAYWNDLQKKNKLSSAADKRVAAGAHLVYGTWLSELGKPEGALKQAQVTLALQPEYTGGLYLAGQSELALGHYSEAEDYARRGRKLAPQESAMYVLMADILVRGNQRDKAIAVLNDGAKICEDKESKIKILWHLANLHLDRQGGTDTQNIKDAVDCMRRLRDLRFSPTQMAFLDARVLYANEEWKAARVRFEEVRPNLNDAPPLMRCLDYWIGYCYLQQGNPDQAMAAFRRSLSFDKFYYKARDGIAQIFLTNGQYRDAVEEYRQAVVGNPRDADAWYAFCRTLLSSHLHRPPEERSLDEVLFELQQARDKYFIRDTRLDLVEADVLERTRNRRQIAVPTTRGRCNGGPSWQTTN